MVDFNTSLAVRAWVASGRSVKGVVYGNRLYTVKLDDNGAPDVEEYDSRKVELITQRESTPTDERMLGILEMRAEDKQL